MTSQYEVTNTDPATPLGNVPESDSVEQEDVILPDPDIDLSSLRTTAATATVAAEINAIKRATGHIPGLQSRLDSIEKTVKQVETLQSTNKQLATRLDSLVAALSDASLITSGQAQNLMSGNNDSNSELLTRLGNMEDLLTRGPVREPEEEVDPRVVAWNEQLAEADRTVYGYAKQKGYDGEIPDNVFARAMAAHSNDLSAAVLEVARYIDTQVAAASRREERKDAASGGTSERSARKGAVTAEQLRNMSLAEVMAIPKEDRDRIAAQGM